MSLGATESDRVLLSSHLIIKHLIGTHLLGKFCGKNEKALAGHYFRSRRQSQYAKALKDLFANLFNWHL